jgi:hypothetical protein
LEFGGRDGRQTAGKAGPSIGKMEVRVIKNEEKNEQRAENNRACWTCPKII